MTTSFRLNLLFHSYRLLLLSPNFVVKKEIKLLEIPYLIIRNWMTFSPDLKTYWFAVTRVCFFKYTRPVGKFFFYHFKMEKIPLILIYNIFVTKNFFFRNEHQKWFLPRRFLLDPVGWRQTNIFLSLALCTFFNSAGNLIMP